MSKQTKTRAGKIRYTKETIEGAVHAVLVKNMRQSDVAGIIGCTDWTVSRWVSRATIKQLPDAPIAHIDTQRLRKELEQVIQERDTFKKLLETAINLGLKGVTA